MKVTGKSLVVQLWNEISRLWKKMGYDVLLGRRGGECHTVLDSICTFTSFQVSPPNLVGSHIKALSDCQVRIQSPEMWKSKLCLRKQMDLLLLGNEECFSCSMKYLYNGAASQLKWKISQVTSALHVSKLAVPPGPCILQARSTGRHHLPFTSSEGASPCGSFFVVYSWVSSLSSVQSPYWWKDNACCTLGALAV